MEISYAYFDRLKKKTYFIRIGSFTSETKPFTVLDQINGGAIKFKYSTI